MTKSFSACVEAAQAQSEPCTQCANKHAFMHACARARTCQPRRVHPLPIELHPHNTRIDASAPVSYHTHARACAIMSLRQIHERTGADAKSKVPVKRPGPGGKALSPKRSRPATSGA
jgi:hypothetical protein